MILRLSLIFLISQLSFTLAQTIINDKDNQDHLRFLSMNDITSSYYPSSLFTKSQIDKGGFLLYFVGKYYARFITYYCLGALYVYMTIWIVNTKYFYSCIEDIIGIFDERREFVRTFFFMFLHGLIYIFVMFFSVFITGDNIGIGVIIGSEFINIFGIIAAVSYRIRQGQEPTMDQWFFLRNSFYYLLGCILLIFLPQNGQILWYMALILFLYGFFYLMILWNSEKFRIKVFNLIGLIHDDDEFNPDEYLNMQRTCSTIEELNENGFINLEDTKFKVKLMQCSKILEKMDLNQKKFRVYTRYQKAGYGVIFALRAKAEKEKKDRSTFYKTRIAQIHAIANEEEMQEQDIKKDIKIKDKNTIKEASEGIENMGNSKVHQGEIEMMRISVIKDKPDQKLEYAPIEMPLADKKPIEEDLAPSPDIRSPDELLEHKDSGEQKDFGENNDHHNILETYQEENLFSVPKGIKRKIWFLLQFPVKLILHFLIPNFQKTPTLKRLIFACFILMGLLGVLSYLAVWWTSTVSWAIGLNTSIMGVNFASVGFSIAFIQYIVQEFEKSEDPKYQIGYLSFKALGIFKLGFGVGLSYFVYTQSISQTTKIITNGLYWLFIVFTAFIGLNSLVIMLCKMRIPKILWNFYAGICVIFWILTWMLIGLIN